MFNVLLALVLLAGSPYYGKPRSTTVTSQSVVGASLSPMWLPRMAVGVPVSQTITVNNVTGSVTYAVSSGTLPAGLSLSSAGVLSGTPTTEDGQYVVVTATVAGYGTVSRTYRMDIEPGITYLTNGDTVYVRGALSANKHIVVKYGKTGAPWNYYLDTYCAYIIADTTADNLPRYRSGPLVTSSAAGGAGGLQSSWISTMQCGNLGPRYGATYRLVTSVGHGRTNADRGSYWHDAIGHQFVLAAISGNVLTFYSMPYDTLALWLMPLEMSTSDSLRHDSLGTNTSAIKIDSQTTDSEAVSQVANASLTLTEWDGDALASGVATRAVALRGVEEYDIIDPSTLDRTNKPWVWNDGDVWFHQKTVYELGAGRTSADVTYTLDSGNAGMAVAAMLPLDVPRPVCAAYDSLYFYIPDLDSTNVQDFSRPHTLTYKGGIGANYIVSADSLLEGAVGIAGTVITMFKNNADSRYGLGLSLGILPLHNGSSDSLTAFADSYRYRIASGGGVYANLLGAYEYAYNWTQANRTLQAHVYRQWFDAAAYDSSKVMFVGKADDNEWVFTGRPLAFVADTTTSPRIIGKYVGEQLAYDNLPSPPQQIPAGGLVVNSAAYAPGWMLFRVVPHLWIEPE